MRQFLHHLHRDQRGTSQLEYLLILALVVLPICGLAPLIVQIISLYARQAWATLVTPFS